MEHEISRVMVGQGWVGMIGLRSIFDELQSLGINDPEKLKTILLELARKKNYIAPSSESEYEEALLREYHRHLGLLVEDGPSVPEILILGPGCKNCDELNNRVMSIAAEIGLQADIRHVKDPAEIGKFGLVPTPALVINGKLECTGQVPSSDKLKSLLESI